MEEKTTYSSLCKDGSSFASLRFDYVIIGGGTAGLVVAARLSEDPRVRVAVLEAGKLRLGDENIESMGGIGAMLNNTDYDWAFRTVPQTKNNDRVYHVPRGMVLGGSSALNFMTYVRPCAVDIDSWGVEGWNWNDLEPYYRKSETIYQNDRQHWPKPRVLDSARHGDSGPIHTSFSAWTAPIENSIVQALSESTEAPFPVKTDPWSGSHLGFFEGISTVDRTQPGKVTRSYAATGYLAPILDRKNLTILTEATVSRVILEKDGNIPQAEHPFRAKGVAFEHGGCSYSVSAEVEVVICGSTIQSPRLLELSGIGNREILSAAGVDCLVNLNGVGENLQEHPMTTVVYELASGDNKELITIDSLHLDPKLLEEHQRLLAEGQTGILSSPPAMMGFVPYATQVDLESLEESISSVEKASEMGKYAAFQGAQRRFIVNQLRDPQSANIHIIGFPGNFEIDKGHSNQSLLTPGPPPGRRACYSFLISPMYPASRGSSHIVSARESVKISPRVDLGMLSNTADLDVLAAGAAFVDRVLSPTSSTQSTRVKGKIANRVAPGTHVDMQDPSQAKDFIRGHTSIFNHILGTCAMGNVVDARLRVKGVSGLRVVDASVIPAQLSGNIMATVYAVAEKAADLIKEDYDELNRKKAVQNG